MSIDDLEFYVPQEVNGEIIPVNIFRSYKIRVNVALYKATNAWEKFKSWATNSDLLFWIFGQAMAGKREWELWIGDEKISLYRTMIEPNRKILLDLVEQVDEKSCKPIVREYNKQLREMRKRLNK